MKKLVVMLISLALAMAFILPAIAADDTQVNVYDKSQIKSIVFAIGVNQYFVNGQTPGITMDAAPFIENDRTYVPVRFLGNALGISNDNITWDDSQGRATLVVGSTKAEMTIGEKEIVTNGQAKAIDVAPQLKPPGRTFLPARFVCEALDFEVDWQDDRYVVVWPKGQPKPVIAKQYVNQLDNFTEANGYRIPKHTNLKINTPPLDNSNKLDIGMLIGLQYPLERQYNDLYNIILSKFNDNVAKDVVGYVKLKTDVAYNLQNKWMTVNNQKIFIGSEKGNYGIAVLIWQPGH